MRQQREGTYRSWIEGTRAQLTGMPEGRLVLQGPAEWPLLQRGVDNLLYVLHQADRRQSNLELALALSESRHAAWSQPGDKLTDAALRVALAEEKRVWATTQTANDRVLASVGALFEEAVEELEALHTERATLREEKLMESYLYWTTRARDEGQGNPDAALNFLVEQDSQDLASHTMVKRLVDVTERAISRSAEDRLARTRTLLRQLDNGEGTPWMQDYRSRVESWGVEAQRVSGEPRPITAREEPAPPPPEN